MANEGGPISGGAGAAPDPTVAVTRKGIEAIEPLIARYVRQTPVIRIDRADFGLQPGPLVLKLEHLQHSGSFKARGAFANLLLRDVPPAGVMAASGGNHGAAVAYAAMTLGMPARIFVPEVSSPAKIARIRGYGAELIVSGDTYADALDACEAWMAASGALAVHAYNQIETMLGAGTLATELEKQVPELATSAAAGTATPAATVMAGVGGGGLLAGVAAGYAGRVRVVGVEPELAPTLTSALQAGRPVDAVAGSVAVDSLAPRRVGELTFPVIEANVREVLLVSDDAIRCAQDLLWDRLRLVGEPGGCAALAALISGRYTPAPSETVTVIVSGANTAAVDFTR
jgi:threonine dehydratase